MTSGATVTIANAFDAERLDVLNAILDREIEAAVEADAGTHRFVDLLLWGQSYLDLIDLPTVVPYLEGILGPKFRLDHTCLDIIRSELGPIGATLHGGAAPFNPVQHFRFSDGRMHNGLSVVAYNLADVNPGDGGFGCITGSHKSNLPFPEDVEGSYGSPSGRLMCRRPGWDGRDFHRGADTRIASVDSRSRVPHDFLQVQPPSSDMAGRVPDA